MLYVAAALALIVGALLGLLGGGGSILTVPMLVYVVGAPPSSAIPTSLIVVGATSLLAMIPAARAGHVRFRAGGLIAAGAVLGAFAGGRLAHLVPGRGLLVAFSVLMLGASFAMMRRAKVGSESGGAAVSHVTAISVGLAIGVVSGLVGAGGGFLIVPALVLVAGVPMRDAVGTSLFVIALQSAAGFAGQIAHANVDAKLAVVVTLASIAGAQIGVRLGKKLSPSTLRAGFAWLVLALGAVMLGREAHPVAGAAAAVLVLAAVAWSRARAPKGPVERPSPPGGVSTRTSVSKHDLSAATPTKA